MVLCADDIQYAQNGHGPAVTPTQEAELRYQTRRLSNHPSIILYDGCSKRRIALFARLGLLQCTSLKSSD